MVYTKMTHITYVEQPIKEVIRKAPQPPQKEKVCLLNKLGNKPFSYYSTIKK